MEENKTNKNAIDNNEQIDAAELPKEVEVVGISFRTSTKIYYFSAKNLVCKLDDEVIVATARGMEFAKVTMANKMVSSSVIVPPLRDVVRIATEADKKKNNENQQQEARAMRICREKIEAHNLEMNLVGAEYTFDNQKLLFYFTSEGRVDFRELVKDLASVFRTRIELRQIGIRDQAKMLGGLGTCGRPFCCSTFLPDFVQVSIKMAKEQNFSLNSAKISGACGRLMCCLRYEHESYEEALKSTPSSGSMVNTPNGVGMVIETRPLAGQVKVRFEDKNEPNKLFACSEVTKISKGEKGQKNQAESKNEDSRPKKQNEKAGKNNATATNSKKI